MSELLQETATSGTVVSTGDTDIVVVSDDELIGHLISSHGDIDLAAERAKLDKIAILSRLPSLDRNKLIEGIKTALTIQTFESFTQAKTVTMSQLDEFSPTQLAKFMLDLANQLSGLVAPPPVQNGGATPSANVFNIINQMNNEAVDAKQELIKRISVIDVASRADSSDRELDAGAATGAPVRLGSDGEAGAERTAELVDLVHHDGSRVGQDQDGRGDSA